MIGISRLINRVQEYAWGSMTVIPELLGKPSPAEKPQAELWMGVHPRAPSEVLVDGQSVSLIDIIKKDPVGLLGKAAAGKFSQNLPFLFKVIAAGKPLSIQAHPSIQQAREGFERENKLNIPMDAFKRSYKDKNHKPEIISVLTPFWALNGFRPIKEMLAILNGINFQSIKKEVRAYKASPDKQGLRVFFKAVMTLTHETKEQAINEALEWAEKPPGPGADSYESEKTWVSKLNLIYPGDIGVLCPLILNLVRLSPGDAFFTRAGGLHAYLDGAGIELMANSDNVLRGGLTPKYIDVQELIKTLDFEPKEFEKAQIKDLPNGEKTYISPAEEFRLSMIVISSGNDYMSAKDRSVEMMICVKGSAAVKEIGRDETLSINRGDSILVPASVEQYSIGGEATLYKASVPF